MAAGYRQFCPVALAAEVLAERWTPLVVRELLCGSSRFSELRRGLPRIPPATLDARLKKLEPLGVVTRCNTNGGWTLTEAGQALFPVIDALGVWAQRWLQAGTLEEQNLDPGLLMWDIRRTVRPLGKGGFRRVIEFRLTGVPPNKQRYWLLRGDGEIDLCYRDPGYPLDLAVAVSLRDLTAIWLGHLELDRALACGVLRLEGSRTEREDFTTWFALSPSAGEAQPRDPSDMPAA